MERFLDKLRRGFLLVDRQGRITFANRYLLEKDLVSEGGRGRRYYEAVRNLDLIRVIHDTFAESKGQELTFRHREEWFRARSLLDEGVFVEVDPVSREIRLEETTKEFLANATHELRTPLTVVRGVLETLYEEEEDPGKRDMILKALKRVENLVGVVEALYTLISLERGVAGNFRTVNLREVLEEVVGELMQDIRGKGIGVRLEVPEDFKLEADPEKFYLMIRNIVDNAVRYNVEGGEVRIRAYEREGRKVIEVEDTGRGIDRSQIPLIFEPFFKGSRERGLGIGLAISKRIAEFHGARIEVESEVGRGSLFRILF
jgi:two-component system phosphate regulon sensor histidine kinase PhoR